MDAYIEIDGKRAKLTEEQLKALGLEPEKKNPFERADIYHVIGESGFVDKFHDNHDDTDDDFFKIANYCTDKELMEQRALHETLNRLLWRYSMEHGGDEINWDDNTTKKWHILFDSITQQWDINVSYRQKTMMPYFATSKTANDAIEEIIKPFMAEHPEFKW